MSQANPSYVQLVRTLGSAGVVRVGGNTADYAHYAPGEAAVSTPYGTVVNDTVLKELGGFLDATGWKLIWALDLGSGSEADTVAEAKAVLAIAGSGCWRSRSATSPICFPGKNIARQATATSNGWQTTAGIKRLFGRSCHIFRWPDPMLREKPIGYAICRG